MNKVNKTHLVMNNKFFSDAQWSLEKRLYEICCDHLDVAFAELDFSEYDCFWEFNYQYCWRVEECDCEDWDDCEELGHIEYIVAELDLEFEPDYEKIDYDYVVNYFLERLPKKVQCSFCDKKWAKEILNI